MRNLLAENTLQDKLIKDVRNNRGIILAERSRQTRGADTVKMKISSELETAVLTWAANETKNIEVDMAPNNGILTIWDFLWQFFEYDAPTPVDTWHWPEGINAGFEDFGNKEVSPPTIPIANIIRASHFLTPTGGKANSITTRVLVFNGVHSIKCAIYEFDALGNAGALVGETEARNIPISIGFQTFNFAAPPTLLPNTNYYLAVWANEPLGANDARTSTHTIGGTKRILKALTYGSWPDPMTGESMQDDQIPIYCTLGEAHRVGQDFSINYALDLANSSDITGRRNLFFRIKNLTGDTKYGVFSIKGYLFEPKAALTENINVV